MFSHYNWSIEILFLCKLFLLRTNIKKLFTTWTQRKNNAEECQTRCWIINKLYYSFALSSLVKCIWIVFWYYHFSLYHWSTANSINLIKRKKTATKIQINVICIENIIFRSFYPKRVFAMLWNRKGEANWGSFETLFVIEGNSALLQDKLSVMTMLLFHFIFPPILKIFKRP